MSRGIRKAVEELFHEACELSTEQRQAYCKTAYAQIQIELSSLLAAHDLDAPLIDRPPNLFLTGVDLKSLSLAEEVLPSTQIGAYRIERMLAEGGMGRVYEASRADGQYRQRVALKVASFTAAVDRFLQERQILANLDHPNIARLLDGGITDSGHPYIVMEYIDGEAIDIYCESRHLGIRDRLRLFLDVCAAVEYAHRNMVAHRDLKPNNILVTSTGIVKLLDFGIAKLLREDSSEPGVQTVTDLRIMTPHYASPEQFCGGNVNAVSDVYSLGVMLYKLLTGKLPYDLTGKTPSEQERIICEQAPARPSMTVANSFAAGPHGASPDRLSDLLVGDLDNIVLLALRKEPDRRYESVAALREDIQRFLEGEAVTATPPTLAYRAAKWVRRHRTPVVAGCLLFIAIMAGIVATGWQALRANREAAVAQAVSDFLQNDLLAQASANTQAGPNTEANPNLKVQTVLDRAADRIGLKFGRQPEAEAAIQDTIGMTYLDLGLYAKAQPHLERALELYRRTRGENDRQTLKIVSHLGRAAYLQGKYPEAESMIKKALAVQRLVDGPDHPDTLYSMSTLARLYDEEGKYAEAEALHRETLESRRRVLGPEHPDTLSSLKYLADLYYEKGDYTRAESLHKQVLESRRRVLGNDHPETLGSMMGLATVYHLQGNYAQAEALFSEALTGLRRTDGPEHRDTLTAMSNLAVVYDEQGKFAQAEKLYRQTLEGRLRLLGPEHPDTLMSMNNLAVVYYERGEYPESAALNEQTLEIRRRVLSAEHPDTLGSMNNLADVYSAQQKYPQAEALFRKALEISRRRLGLEHPLTLAMLMDLASMYQRHGKYALAETNAAQALAGRRHSSGAEQADTMASATDLALACESQGKFEKAEPLARESFEFYKKKQPDDWQRFRAESLLGAILAGQKKYAEAEPMLREGYQGMLARKERIGVPDRDHLDRARKWIAQFYVAWGKAKKAA